MSREDAIKLAVERANRDGLTFRVIEWAKYYSDDDLPQEMKSEGTFWVVRFEDDDDRGLAQGSGFSVFVYDEDGSTKIPMQM